MLDVQYGNSEFVKSQVLCSSYVKTGDPNYGHDY